MNILTKNNNMLFKSGNNLNTSVLSFIAENKQLTVYSAYIKLDQLKAYNDVGNIDRIIVRWEIEDLVKGISDFESLYEYCKVNNIALYRNTRIHLKAIWNNENSVLFGSANVTGKGMGERGSDYNYELSGIANQISFDDISYLNFIIQESEFVSNALFSALKKVVDSIELPIFDYPEFPTSKKMEDDFLISQLPMTKSPESLLTILRNPNNFSLEEQLKASHDKTIFNIDIECGTDNYLEKLKVTFNNKAIIKKLKLDIAESPRKSMGYGQVVKWIQDNTTTVPTPLSWEIKKDQFVNNLYEWICFFDENFTWDVPGSHSQVIKYNNAK
jgi:hypothetical protein